MHLAYWRLARSPFSAASAAPIWDQSPVHDEALARLHFLVAGQRRLALLAGPAGCGKSSGLAAFARVSRRQPWFVTLTSGLATSAEEWLQCVSEAWHARRPGGGGSVAELWRSVESRLQDYQRTGERPVLAIDDADQAPATTASAWERLLVVAGDRGWPLALVLAGGPRLAERLPSRLIDRVDLRIELAAWSAQETSAFVACALAFAGRTDPIFASDALARLHELSEGVPRRVARLAELGLAAGAAAGQRAIDAAMLEAVHEQLERPGSPTPQCAV